MKKITSLLLLFASTVFYAQSNGITYQAIIYNPNGEVTPGYNNANSPLANTSVCLQFSIIDAASQTEYQEKITTTTDEFGMVNLVIGSGIQTGGYATSFSNIYWSVTLKSLKVALDSKGQCTNFIEISNQPFNSVPFAFAANSAENVTGVVPIENGGTNATTVLGAKTNLGLQNVDNTRDIDKPISTATQAALNLKENLSNKSNSVTTDATSTTKYPSVKAVKDYVDVSINLGGTALTNEATIRAAADTVLTNNLAAEIANRTNADASINNNLALEITNRTNADLLKEDLVNKSNNVNTDGASTTKYPTVKAIKTYVDASDSATSNALAAETAARIAADNTLTTNIAAEVNRATATDNTLTSNMLSEFIRATGAENTLTTNLATEVTNRTNADLLKENLVNKSNNVTTDGTSTTKYPTVKSVKDYVDASAASGTTALTNEATIRAAADATLTTNLATEVSTRATADTTLQTNITTLGSTVTANATTAAAATALKENSANKSTDVTLADATNTKFPTELAVKTFVTGQISTSNSATNSAIAAVQADVDANETASNLADTTLQTNITTLGSTVTANATTAAAANALKENSANKSTDVTLADGTNTKFPTELAVKTFVTGQISTSNSATNSAIAAVQADVDQNEVDSDAAEATLQTNINTLASTVGTNLTNTNTAIAAVQADVDANETAANAAIALKENSANKSTDVTLADATNTKFPTELAVKTFVTGQISTSNSATNSAIAAVQADVDANETAANAAIALKENSANKSTDVTLADATNTKFPTELAVKTFVTGQISTSNSATNSAIAAVQADVDANETASNLADTTLQTNINTLGATVTANATTAAAATALKENSANKSTDVNLADGTNTKFPTELAVKTFVTGQINTSNSATNSAIAAVQADVDQNEIDSDAADTTLQTNINTLTSTVGTNLTNTNTAIAAVQADVDANETAANAAIALKENSANKSTDGTLADATNVKFPTELAVKTFVTGQISTSNSATNSAIAAVQADVDQNEVDSDAAEATLQTNINTLASTVGTNLTNTNTAIAAVQADVDANETAANAAIALKENSANKSTDVTLADATNVKFPTELAVKTFVTGQINTSNSATNSAIAAVQADVDANETASNLADTTLQTNINTLGSTVTANATTAAAATALKENSANKSTDVTLADATNTKFPTELAVKTFVTGQISTSNSATNSAIAAVQADVDQNEVDSDAAEATLQSNINTLTSTVGTNLTNTNSAIAAVQADVDANETAANAAIALKENSANKSTDGTLADATNVKFPTELAVKTFVTGQISTSNSATNSAIAAVQADVDANETAANAAIALKENSANKSTDVTLADATNTKFPTALAVKTFVTGQISTSNSATNSAIAAVQADVDQNEVDSDAAEATLQTNINTLASTVGTNLTNTNTAIAAVQADVDANETEANAAIALKENSANKSTDVTLADATNVKFPTALAVKTFVTGQINTSNSATNSAIAAVQADVDQNEIDSDAADTTLQTNINTLASTVGTNLTNTNTAIAAVQADVDANETAANAAIALKENSANKSTDVTLADATNVKFPTELAVKTFVTGQINTSNSATNSAIAAVQADVDQNEIDSDAADTTLQTNINTLTSTVGTNLTNTNTAIAAVQADVDANETAANAAIALKENSANKSTDVTLADGTNTKFPTALAVKTFVTGQISTSNSATNSAIAAVQVDVDQNEVDSDAAEATLQTNINTLASTVGTNLTNTNTAIAAVQADVDANETAANAAIALKENSANKSTDVTLADATNTKFPTELAVKTFVTGQISTSNSATNSAIAAVQADVDQNEVDSDAAEATLQTNINTLASTVGTNLTNTNTAIAAVQADVDANETAANVAIALKENSANKSTDVTLADATNVKFPTALAVKTFVTGQISTSNSATNSAIAAVQADVDQNEVDSDAAEATLQTNINTLTSTVGTNLTNTNSAIAAVQADVDANETAANAAIALKENSANKSTDGTLADATNVKFPTELAVKTFVTGQISTSNSATNSAIAAVQADVDQNEVDSDAAEATLQTNINTLASTVGTNLTNTNTAIAAVQADVDANETAANAAIALKENSANKSTDVTLADGTNTKFPTALAVKTFVTGQISTSNSATNSAIAAVQADVDQNEVDSDAAEATLQSNINSLTSTVGTNLTNTNTAIAAVQADVDANETAANAAIALKENSANKSTDVTLADATNVKFPTALAVKTFVTGQISTSNSATNSAIAAVQADVDQNEVDSDAAEATLQSNINSLTSTVGTNLTNTNTAIAAVQADVDANETAANVAIALKENSANKSTDVTLADATNVKFPTALAVKTYVNNQISAANATNADLTGMVTSNGNATTVVTNANLTGVVTSTGNATAIADAALSIAKTNGLQTAIDSKVADAINDGTTTVAPSQNAVFDALALKAPLASPTFTGTPTLPTGTIGVTQTAGNNTTALATTEFVTVAISSSNYVDLTTAQTVGGAKTFSSDLTVSGITIGRGPGSTTNSTNTALGFEVLTGQNGAGGGSRNTAVGSQAAKFMKDGVDNTAIGFSALGGSTNPIWSDYNTAIGSYSLSNTLCCNGKNTAVGYSSLQNTTGSYNTSLGYNSGTTNTSGVFNTIIGANANVASGNLTNATAIGGSATVSASNTIQLGSNSVTNVNTSGALTTGTVKYPNTHNSTAGQVLTTNGSGVASWATPSTTATAYSGTLPVANGGTAATTAAGALTNLGAAPIASPTFTGDAKAVTATAGDNDESIATTMFVTSAVSTANATNANLTGVVTSTGNATAIANGAITNAMLANGAVANLTGTNSGDQTNILGNAATATTADNVSGVVAVANGGTGSATQNFVDLTTDQTVAGNKTFTGRIFGKTAFLNGGDGTFGNAFIVSNNDSGFLASYNSLGTIRTGFLGFSSGNSVTLKAEESNSLILGAGNQNTLTLGADQKATFAGGAVLNGQTDINGSLTANNGTFSQRITGKTAFLNGGDGTFGNAFIVSNNDSGFLASYNSLGTIRTGFLGFSSGNSVTLKAEESNSLILGAGNQNTLTLGANQNATFSGNITGASFIKSGGTASQFLKADGTVDSATYLTSAGTATNVSGIVAVANGGTGQTTIAGIQGALGLAGTNVAIGASSGASSQGAGGVGVGNGTGQTNQGSQSVAIGYVAGNSNQGAYSVAIGSNAAQSGQGSESVAIGLAANSAANKATALGGYSAAGHVNSTAIGYQAVANAANTIQLGADGVTVAGSTAITNVKTSGTLTAGTITYPNTSGSANQVLTTDGSGVASWATPSGGGATVYEASDEFPAAASQIQFTLSQTPSSTSKVKMYINGIRVSNAAYSISGNSLTYDPILNGAYVVTVNDRVQFDYSY